MSSVSQNIIIKHFHTLKITIYFLPIFPDLAHFCTTALLSVNAQERLNVFMSVLSLNYKESAVVETIQYNIIDNDVVVQK